MSEKGTFEATVSKTEGRAHGHIQQCLEHRVKTKEEELPHWCTLIKYVSVNRVEIQFVLYLYVRCPTMAIQPIVSEPRRVRG